MEFLQGLQQALAIGIHVQDFKVVWEKEQALNQIKEEAKLLQLKQNNLPGAWASPVATEGIFKEIVQHLKIELTDLIEGRMDLIAQQCSRLFQEMIFTGGLLKNLMSTFEVRHQAMLTFITQCHQISDKSLLDALFRKLDQTKIELIERWGHFQKTHRQQQQLWKEQQQQQQQQQQQPMHVEKQKEGVQNIENVSKKNQTEEENIEISIGPDSAIAGNPWNVDTSMDVPGQETESIDSISGNPESRKQQHQNEPSEHQKILKETSEPPKDHQESSKHPKNQDEQSKQLKNQNDSSHQLGNEMKSFKQLKNANEQSEQPKHQQDSFKQPKNLNDPPQQQENRTEPFKQRKNEKLNEQLEQPKKQQELSQKPKNHENKQQENQIEPFKQPENQIEPFEQPENQREPAKQPKNQKEHLQQPTNQQEPYNQPNSQMDMPKQPENQRDTPKQPEKQKDTPKESEKQKDTSKQPEKQKDMPKQPEKQKDTPKQPEKQKEQLEQPTIQQAPPKKPKNQQVPLKQPKVPREQPKVDWDIEDIDTDTEDMDWSIGTYSGSIDLKDFAKMVKGQTRISRAESRKTTDPPELSKGRSSIKVIPKDGAIATVEMIGLLEHQDKVFESERFLSKLNPSTVRLRLWFTRQKRLGVNITVSPSEMDERHSWPVVFFGTGKILNKCSGCYTPVWTVSPVTCERPTEEITLDTDIRLSTSRENIDNVTLEVLESKNYCPNNILTVRWSVSCVTGKIREATPDT